MKIVIVKKTGVLGELDWKKNIDLDGIYKKCGFRKNKDFCKRHTWKIRDDQYVSLYSKDNHLSFSTFSNKISNGANSLLRSKPLNFLI